MCTDHFTQGLKMIHMIPLTTPQINESNVSIAFSQFLIGLEMVKDSDSMAAPWATQANVT